MIQALQSSEPHLAVHVGPTWPNAYGVFTRNAVTKLANLEACFIFESDAWRYILAQGIRAIAWVERI